MRAFLTPVVVASLVAPLLGCPPEARAPIEEEPPRCPPGTSGDGYRCIGSEVTCPEGSGWDGTHCIALADPVSDPLIGAWSVEGARPDGVAYSGDAAIAKAGSAFHIVWSIGGATYSGVAVRRGDVVSVGWSDGAEHGVVDFDAKGDGTLSGVWFDAQGGKPGREVLAGGLPNLAGIYTVTQGLTPDGSSYAGTCDLAVTGDLHTLVWHIGKASYRGLGIRGGGILSVGFDTAAAGNFGVVQYRLVGDKLVGRWAEWSQKVAQLGTETLVRR